MTETEIIRQLIIDNWYKDWDERGEPCFSLGFRNTKLSYVIVPERTVDDMLDWFHTNVIRLADETIKEHH